MGLGVGVAGPDPDWKFKPAAVSVGEMMGHNGTVLMVEVVLVFVELWFVS